MKGIADVVLTFAIAFAGGAMAALIGLPVPWLIGSAILIAATNLAGAPIRMPTPIRDAAFLVLGALAGSGVTPEVLQQIALWPLSFLIQMIGVAGVIAATMIFLERGLGWDRQTAFFASLPGALSLVVATASQTRADMVRVLVVQSVRLLFLVVVLTPFLAWFESGAAGDIVTRGSEWTNLPGWRVVLFVGLVIVGSVLGHLSRLPGGILLGALLASAVLHGTEIAPVMIPEPVVVFGLVAIGILIGERVRREHRRDLPRLLPASIAALVIGFAASALAGVAAHVLLGIDLGRIAVAYAPGALEALTAIAYQFNIDPAYVAAHHVVRFVILSLSIPLLARWIAGAAVEPPDADEIAGR